MKYSNLLITGSAGFIGFHLTKRLAESESNILCIDNINDYYSIQLKLDRLENLGFAKNDCLEWNKVITSSIFPRLKFIRMNIEDRESLPIQFENWNFDAVINLAAQAGVRYSIENPNSYIESNIVGFLNILECCRKFNIKHLVYASSSSVYGENEEIPFAESHFVDKPLSLYAATKKSNELMAYSYSHLYKIPTTGLRFFTVYGPWGRPDMAPMLFANAINNNLPIKVFNNGEMSRDFTYIDDIVSGIIIALNKSIKLLNYQILNIGNGAPVNLLDFINELENKLNREAQKDFMPMQKGDVSRTWANTEEIHRLGFRSTTNISQGVEKFVKWFRDYYNENSN